MSDNKAFGCEWKQDDRPSVGLWAKGGYLCKCGECGCTYMGDKRSVVCADCAYAFKAGKRAGMERAAEIAEEDCCSNDECEDQVCKSSQSIADDIRKEIGHEALSVDLQDSKG